MFVAAILLPLAVAHKGCGGHHIGRRNVGGPVVHSYHERQVANSNIDPTAQCNPYTYQPVEDLKTKYPAIWEAADLVEGDTAAASLFAQINATLNERLPNIGPNGDGTHMGDWGSSFAWPKDDPSCWWTNTLCTKPDPSTGIPDDLSTLPEPETWGFGFDDGPNCSHNALYNFLQENNQTATMFYIGSNVMDLPVEAIRGHADGHQLCVHTWSHQYMTSFSNQQAFAELYYTQRAIKDIVGVTPKCWRPPYGDVDNRIRLIAHLLNMTTVLWVEDTNDWEQGSNGVTAADIDANYQNIFDKAKNGSYATYGPIVLNHEIDNFTMQEMMDQYANIKAAFKYIVPIATAFNITNPYMETNITFPTFDSYIAGDRNENASATVASSSAAGANGTSTADSSVKGSASVSANAELHKQSTAEYTFSIAPLSILFGAAVSLLL